METNNNINYEDYIGREVVGFRFEETDMVYYNDLMDGYVGETGKVVEYYGINNSFRVDFRDTYWNYPADLVIKQLEQKEELAKMMEKDEEAGVYDSSDDSDKVKKTFNPQPYYDNSKGSLYKVATDMKIEKGDKFLCIKDVIKSDGDVAYKKGEIYTSEYDYCITDISGDKEHLWDERDIIIQYFKPLKEVDRIYTDATDRLRELHKNYTGYKSGNSRRATFFDNKSSDHETFCFHASVILSNPYITYEHHYDYVAEEVFIELMGLTDKPDYDNSKGSLYKVATERGWNPYIFDVVKRLERGGKKGPLKQEIEKSIDVLKIWLQDIKQL